jgi:transposase
MLCGVAPIPASGGKTQRHRLNRGGDRAFNSALHLAVVTRLRVDPRTKEYVKRRTADGPSKLEIIRCLKRYLARELYHLIKNSQPRHHDRLTNGRASQAANTRPSRSPRT